MKLAAGKNTSYYQIRAQSNFHVRMYHLAADAMPFSLHYSGAFL
jgi:hypothetical protein